MALTQVDSAVRPDFAVIGVAKCATTALCTSLEQHPEVFITTPKEPKYWGARPHEVHKTEEWYSSLFLAAPPTAKTGDGTTRATNPEFADETSAHLAEARPDIRLICLVRHPIDRLVSDWQMRVRENLAPPDINEAVRTTHLLVEHSLYTETLRHYRDRFPAEQLLVQCTEDLISNGPAVIARSLQHIGVEPAGQALASVVSNSAESRRVQSRLVARATGVGLLNTERLRRIRARCPDRLWRLSQRALTRDKVLTPQWCPAVLAEVKDRVRDDAGDLLESIGKPRDFWEI